MRRILPAVAAALIVAACLRSPADPPDPPDPVVVGFRLEANLPWVDVTFDGKGPFRMAFDTGASTTVILPEAALEKGLIKGNGKQWSETTQFVKVNKVRMGPLECDDLKVAIMAVPHVSTPASLLQLKAEGVIGFNFISRFVTTIDYRMQTISFVENHFTPADPEQSLPGVTVGPRTWFGVQVEEADPRDVKSNGYDGGLKVNSVTDLSPASKAGIEEGDIIVEIAGTPTVRGYALKDFLSRSAPGQKVAVLLIRDGMVHQYDVVLGTNSGARKGNNGK
jgi:hypothetical protein